MIAFHGDPKIQAKYIARVEDHAAADDFIRGTYGSPTKWATWRGCAVGCTLHGEDHHDYETELGIPEALAFAEDRYFENVPYYYAMQWPVRFLKAIPLGADLKLVPLHLLHYTLQRLREWSKGDWPIDSRIQATIEQIIEPLLQGKQAKSDPFNLHGSLEAIASERFHTGGDCTAMYVARSAAHAIKAAYTPAYSPYAMHHHLDSFGFAVYKGADSPKAEAVENEMLVQSEYLLRLLASAPVPSQELEQKAIQLSQIPSYALCVDVDAITMPVGELIPA